MSKVGDLLEQVLPAEISIEPIWRGPLTKYMYSHRLSGARMRALGALCTQQHGALTIIYAGAQSMAEDAKCSVRWAKRLLREFRGEEWASGSVRETKAKTGEKPPAVLEIAERSLGGRRRKPKEGSPGMAHGYRLGPYARALVQARTPRAVVRQGPSAPARERQRKAWKGAGTPKKDRIQANQAAPVEPATDAELEAAKAVPVAEYEPEGPPAPEGWRKVMDKMVRMSKEGPPPRAGPAP